jgi:hypothetical protein
MTIPKSLIFSFFLALTSGSASANPIEIKHLLGFIASTECEYQRNGKAHTGKEALKHIKKKYEYFREDIQSTEDFIAYSATKSKMSGNQYKVSCPGRPTITSAVWLTAELQLYRQKNDQLKGAK